MKLKNILIVVKDIERSRRFYEEVFGLKLILDERCYPDVQYVNKLMTHSWGQRVVRFYDPDGNLIEVGTPI